MTKRSKTSSKKPSKSTLQLIKEAGIPTSSPRFSAEERKKIDELFPD